MKKTICLNMIVKNESHVIERCLASVKNLIDYWIIVDTGSTDGTQEIIKKYLNDIPGELYESPFVDFSTNRNEAMSLANDKGDYLLFIDADDRLVIEEDFTLPDLSAEIYCITQRESHEETFRAHDVTLLAVNNGSFEYNGKIHEYLKNISGHDIEIKKLDKIYNQYICDGARSKDPNKIANDIALLKKGIEEDPTNARNHFYLARTYYSHGNYLESLESFKEYVKIGQDPIEIYTSLLYIGIIQIKLNEPSKEFIKSLTIAHLYRPSRSEALYEILRYYTENQEYLAAFMLSRLAVNIPPTTDNLFVETWVTDWGCWLYHFICAHALQQYNDASIAIEKLSSNPRIPTNVIERYKLKEWQALYKERELNS